MDNIDNMENINYTDYIFIIYSCKKNLSYANNIYNLLKNKLKKCKIFIIYGDTTIKTNYKIIHNFIILNVKDDYVQYVDTVRNDTSSCSRGSFVRWNKKMK